MLRASLLVIAALSLATVAGCGWRTENVAKLEQDVSNLDARITVLENVAHPPGEKERLYQPPATQ